MRCSRTGSMVVIKFMLKILTAKDIILNTGNAIKAEKNSDLMLM
ncbi:hypothetical protein GPAL_1903 [Glaciecola pallidula DSM 14239 = ACAM 615]|uniref:Uncharacterized protein n=1 Tax=Brumicola pallidula DSM 14239 = ACAM 615 TaxID=1121922 RepID=K6Y7M0_9ALTE|nr:hypothetical protein GPAL_1903 [Glaciecola pallidula DSM 14239 = ACAM 615]